MYSDNYKSKGTAFGMNPVCPFNKDGLLSLF